MTHAHPTSVISSPMINGRTPKSLGLAVAVACAVGLFAGAGCKGAQSSPGDVTQQSIAFTQQRLRGTWTLVSFTPEVPLEQSLQAFLQLQFGRMKITVDGDKLTAQGLGIQTQRRIAVRSGYADHFDAVIYDSFGVGYETSNDFQGEQVLSQIVTLPWRGKAVLTRTSPPGR